MKHLIKLTDHYSIVLVPKDAFFIERERRNDGHYMLSYATEIFPKGWCEHKYIDIGNQFWVIGTLESISEDQTREIVGEFALRQTSNGKTYTSSLEYLIYFIESKGVKEDYKKVIIQTGK
jgi:hypothetical protein